LFDFKSSQVESLRERSLALSVLQEALTIRQELKDRKGKPSQQTSTRSSFSHPYYWAPFI